jgi:hypothetical protein
MLRYSGLNSHQCTERASMNRTGLTICLALLMASCASTPDCDPEAGFAAGIAGDPAHPACGAEPYLDAHRIGHALEEMRRDREQLLAEEDRLDARDRARLRALERDIPELETLARMQGLLPPAPPPES